MADTKEEQIVQAIFNNLKKISLVNGYQNDIPAIQRFEMGGNDFVDVPLLVVQLGEVNFVERVRPAVWELATIFVAVYVRHDKSIDTRSTDAILLSLDGDIYRSIMEDFTLGGLATSVSRVSVTPDDIEEPIVHVAHISEFVARYTHPFASAVDD